MNQLFRWPPSWATLYLLPALFVGFTVHELAHALVAYLLGDTSQVERKRLSFNPLRHISWLGMVAFLLVGFGWAKPVWIDHGRLRTRNPALGLFLVSIAGAAANLATALLVLLGLSATIVVVWGATGASPFDVVQFLMASDLQADAQGLAVALSYYMLIVNLLLAVFNLLPLPPLDGFQALMSLLVLVRGALRRQSGRALGPAPKPSAGPVAPTGEASQAPAQIHFGIGLDYHKEGQLDEAIARYRQAIEHDEEFALAYYNQGLAYWAKGRPSLAANAFRAAARSSRDPAVRAQAEQQLRHLTRREQAPGAPLGPPPAPLEPGAAGELDVGGAPPLDPELARRVWLRLSIGAAGMVAVALAGWLFVTLVTLSAIG